MSAPLVWGLFVRGLALLFAIAFWSLRGQILGLAGARGITPVAQVLARARRDFPGWRRFVYFPTLLWIRSDDAFLRRLPDIGLAAAIVAFLVGPLSTPALAFAWVIYLSLDVAADLLYPWDCVLFEAGLLAIFLPPLGMLPSLELAAAPAPALAWAFRWLLFRVMFGFGKYKFFGPGKLHADYLKTFMISMPLSTPLGVWAHRLPRAIHAAALAGLFVVEVISPAFLFAPAPLPMVTGALVVALMIVIQLTGNFGFFNAAMVVLAIVCLDSDLSLGALRAPTRAEWLPTAIAAVSISGGLLQLPFNSWITRAWPHWPAFAMSRWRAVRALATAARWLGTFRISHAYGVFSPESGPPAKWIAIIEGTEDGSSWQAWPYRFLPTSPSSPARFVAPHHPRLDHMLVYEAFGLAHHNLLGSVVGIGNPYRFARHGLMDRLLERLLEGSPEVLGLLGPCPFTGPPIALRVSLFAVELAERGRWSLTRVHTHLPARGVDASLWNDWLPSPERFHPDEVVWQRRSRALERALARPALDADEARALGQSSPDRSLDDARARLVLRIVRAEESRGAPAADRFDRVLAAYDAIARNTLEIDRRPDAIQRGLLVLARVHPELASFHARKARLRALVLRNATDRPPSVAPAFLRHLGELARSIPADTDEVVPRFERHRRAGWIHSTS